MTEETESSGYTFQDHGDNCVIWNDNDINKEVEEFKNGLKSPVSTKNHSYDTKDRCIKKKKIKEGSQQFYSKRFIFLRHGERLDYVFPEWFEDMVKTKKYIFSDLNQPDSLSHLNRDLGEFKLDTPLTNTGSIMSQLVGKNLHENNLVPDYIYCSPALRCIQTAALIRVGSESKALIRIEPGLYEENIWIGKCDGTSPCMTMEELALSSICGIDYDYRPFVKLSKLFCNPENYNDYNARLQMTIDKLINKHDKGESKSPQTILIVGHASTVDVAVGYFSYPKRKITKEEGKYITKFIPYHGGVTIERNKNGDWKKNFESLKCYSMYQFDTTCDIKFIKRDIVK
uniref:Protein UBASH3A homolog (inferred by orthology to a D. melanogaster protein) n=1 Tax=Strongyloides venezuelensis TaxID=75913 RepID=A0A0K0FZ16_STRVS